MSLVSYQPATGTRHFLLWRQDDNGNRFLVGTFVSEEAALEKMAELTRTPHRQIYWIEGEAELPV